MNFQSILLENFSLFHKGIFFFLCSLFSFFLFFPIFYNFFLKKKCYQFPSMHLSENHRNKKNIPILGGIIILFNIFFISIMGLKISIELIIIYVGLFTFGILGFYDDYLKFKLKNNKSITLIKKLGCLIILSISIAFILVQYEFYQYREHNLNSLFSISIPFFKQNIFGFITYFVEIQYFNIGFVLTLSIIFYALVILCTSLAVNFTDGLDGLASGSLIFTFISLSFFSYHQNLPKLYIFLWICIGSLLGFLFFNIYPAKIFMGDIGALSLGAALGIFSILLHRELSILYIGLIFVLEFASVCIQLLSYKLYKRPFFLIAPLHHYYEKKGHHEVKIVIRFWIVQVIMMMISFFEIPF